MENHATGTIVSEFIVHFWATGLTITHIRNILEVYPQVEPTAFFGIFRPITR